MEGQGIPSERGGGKPRRNKTPVYAPVPSSGRPYQPSCRHRH